jgi:hypothetical protein
VLARSSTAAHREVKRARVLLMAADGVANSKIAATVGVTPVTVRSLRGRFADDHRPTTVQINTQKLLTHIRFHLGASSPSRTRLGHSQSSRWEREEAPLLHHISGV